MNVCTSQVAGEEYADFIFRSSGLGLEELSQTYGNNCISYVDGEYAIVHQLLKDSLPISVENHSYLSIPFLYGLLDTTSMERSGILSTFQQPALNSQGEQTIIGFIDTGIDYQNPMFRSPSGTTRILGIWDQTLPGGGFQMEGTHGIPFSFLYGQEYVQENINAALADPNPLSIVPSVDTVGHGTFLAGIAAGGPTPTQNFTGASPACYIGVVKLKPVKQYLRDYYLLPESADAYQSNDLMMAVAYLRLLALRHRMPLVLCIGLGTNQGGHNGYSPFSQVLNNLQQILGISAVCAGGNEVGFRHHYFGRVTQSAAFDEVELKVGDEERGFVMELWANLPEIYTVGFVSPTGEVIDRIPFRAGEDTTVRFSLENTTVTVSYVASIGGQNDFLALMRFSAPTSGIWRIRIYPTLSITGVYHLWLPLHGFLSDDTYFLNADPFTTITSPGNAAFPITVSAYNHLNNSLYIHSSRGYTRDGRVKPDLAAPGVDVFGPGLSSVPGEYPMTRMSGSSVSAAHVAGAVANLYSWGFVQGHYPQINNSSIKAFLTRGASRNPNFTYPNREWGYGTLNLYDSYVSLRD